MPCDFGAGVSLVILSLFYLFILCCQQTHRAPSALTAWSFAVRPMLREKGAAERLMTFLPDLPSAMLSVDEEKSNAAFLLLGLVLECVPFFPCDESHPDFLDLPERERCVMGRVFHS